MSYDSNGGLYNSGTIATRFGTWNSALEKAELNLVQQRNVSKEDLFVNIEEVWIKLGRQTVYRDMQSFITKYTVHQYTSKFGTWRKALEAFVEFINSDGENIEIDKIQLDENNSTTNKK